VRPRPVIWHLVRFALGLAGPVLVLAAGLAYWHASSEEKRLGQDSKRIMREAASAIEREFEMLGDLAELISISPDLIMSDYVGLHTALRQSRLPREGVWVVVRGAEGHQVLNTSLDPGKPLPTAKNPQRHGGVIGRGQVHVSDLFTGHDGRWVISVTTPAPDGFHSVSVAVTPDYLRRKLEAIQAPQGWILTTNDRTGRVAGRTASHAQFVGSPQSPAGRAETKDVPPGQEGAWKDVVTLEGRPVIGHYKRLASSGYLVSTAILPEVYRAPYQRLIAFLVAIILAIAVASAIMAYITGTELSRAIGRLTYKAQALRRLEVLEPQQFATSITEINGVAMAMRDAAISLRDQQTRRNLMVDELNHRVKNTLATIQSIARRTFHTVEPGLYQRFEGRLFALSHTHSLLTMSEWRGASLRDIVKAETAMYDGQVFAEGPEIVMPPRAAIALGMALHELVTNASKYGALSVIDGHVDVKWSISVVVEGEDSLRLEWREIGGPEVEPPKRPGFGTRLIEASLEREMQGKLRYDYETGGLWLEVDIPCEANRIVKGC
jgi:two-component sensor histidine kinase